MAQDRRSDVQPVLGMSDEGFLDGKVLIAISMLTLGAA
ncbi:hypothetical protein GJW-30_1_04454 [Variibacter gotjawalensis]|uniref:Uncharacterized protein n=1 Tax=Variibacter gotjawalensis TaxID=1333996 RepID=A0A0S3Q137_9BRAD|nr:hypothetical protein [Variibacter gotjawalensis]RZS49628.1 hypothetical protein EV661_2066 [Variibacter gotjawalensis]BAT61892.1 hypothetical protein GJW-30_1_04454 [Variibacter gotjawalensis]